MRIVFAGTPEFASAHLQALLEQARHEVVAVLTQPDRPSGRGKKLKASPVKELALANELAIMQPPSLRNESAQTAIAELKPDIMVVVAYGLILPKAVLTIPRFGCINVHGSILPRWRGAAPIQRAVEAADQESGVTIMQMDEGMDTGDIIKIVRCPITPDMTAGDLYQTLEGLGPKALIDSLVDIETGAARFTKQNDAQATHAAKLSPDEGEIDWQQAAAAIQSKVHGFNPAPGAWTTLADDQNNGRFKLWNMSLAQGRQDNTIPGEVVCAHKKDLIVACGEGGTERIRIARAQLPGKRAMASGDIINGCQSWLTPGYVFGARR